MDALAFIYLNFLIYYVVPASSEGTSGSGLEDNKSASFAKDAKRVVGYVSVNQFHC